jgi:hypothetical protein
MTLAALSLAACATTKVAGPAGGQALPFIENDFPKALAEAKARSLPLFIDAWAPW